MANPLRRRRIDGRCCCCNPVFIIIAPIITIVMVLAIAVGGAFFAYETWGKSYLGLELSEVWSLGKNAMTNLSQEEINALIVNRFSNEDLDSFYTEFKNTAYIKDDCKIDFVDIITSTLKTGDIANGADPSTQNPLSKIEFDAEKLKADLANVGDGQPYVPKKMTITDRQVGALVSQILNSLLFSTSTENGDTTASLEGEDGALETPATEQPKSDLLSKILTEGSVVLEQVIIKDFSDKAQTVFEMTVSMPLQKILKEVIASFSLEGIVKTVVEQVIKIFPETMYLSVNLKPYNATGEINFAANKMTAEDSKNIIKLFATLSEKTGNASLNISTLFAQLGSKVNEVFTKMDESVNLSFVEADDGGAMEILPIEALLHMLKLDGEDGVTEEDLMLTLKAISSIDVDGIISSIGKYDPSDIHKLNAQIKSKFPLHASYDFDIAKIISGGGFDGLVDNISLSDCDKSFFDRSVADSVVYFSGKDLGGLIDAVLDKQINPDQPSEGEDAAPPSDLAKYGLALEQTLIKKDATLQNKYYITFTLSLSIKNLIIKEPIEGEDSQKTDIQQMLDNLISALVPDKTYLTATVSFSVDDSGKIIHKLYEGDPGYAEDINPDAQADNTRLALNNLTAEKTDSMIEVVSKIFTKFSGSTESIFDMASITNQLDKVLRDALKTLESAEMLNGLQLGFATIGDTSYYRIPSVYELVQKIANANDIEDPATYVSTDDIHSILRTLFNFSSSDYTEQNYDRLNFTNLDGFFDSLNVNLFFNKMNNAYPLNKKSLFGIGAGETEKFGFDTITDVLKTPNSMNFHGGELGMFSSNKINSELKTLLSSNSFAELIFSKIKDITISGLKDVNLIYAFLSTEQASNNDEIYLKLALTAKVDMPSAQKYLPDTIYVELSMPFNPTDPSDLAGITAKSSISISNLGDKTQEIFKLINGFTSGAEGESKFTYDAILSQLIEMVTNITKTLNNDDLGLSYNKNNAEQGSFETITKLYNNNYVVNLTLPSIYDFMRNVIIADKTLRPDSDALRLMLKQFNTYTFVNPYNNDANDDKFKNIIIGENESTQLPFSASQELFITDLGFRTMFNEQLQDPNKNPIDLVKNANVKSLEINGADMLMTYGFDLGELNAGDYTDLIAQIIPKSIFASVITSITGGSSAGFSVNGLTNEQMDLLFTIVNANKQEGAADITYEALQAQINTFSADTIKNIEKDLPRMLLEQIPENMRDSVEIKTDFDVIANAATPLVSDSVTYYGNGNGAVGDRGGYIKFTLVAKMKTP